LFFQNLNKLNQYQLTIREFNINEVASKSLPNHIMHTMTQLTNWIQNADSVAHSNQPKQASSCFFCMSLEIGMFNLDTKFCINHLIIWEFNQFIAREQHHTFNSSHAEISQFSFHTHNNQERVGYNTINFIVEIYGWLQDKMWKEKRGQGFQFPTNKN